MVHAAGWPPAHLLPHSEGSPDGTQRAKSSNRTVHFKEERDTTGSGGQGAGGQSPRGCPRLLWQWWRVLVLCPMLEQAVGGLWLPTLGTARAVGCHGLQPP